MDWRFFLKGKKNMCFFPFTNTNKKGEAYRKGITEFDCGCCPECLGKRARLWALRCSAEAQNNIGCMVTLTYDSYKKDKNGNIIGENPPELLQVNKRDCQLFIKRLRKHFQGTKIKYLITAEYGKRTHRAHYHAILFGIDFTDRIRYKKSDRGNIIYKSKTLTDIWNNGICTIDAVNINAAVARYCTKYCAKDSRCDDTFMLMSRGIGEDWLMDNFNGKSYIVDGREYAIPKQIWQKKIAYFYRNNYIYNLRNCTYKYRSLRWYLDKFGDNIISYQLADYNAKCRKYFRSFRDSNKLYKNYLKYWLCKNDLHNLTKPNVFSRILQLPNEKYFHYKQACLDTLNARKNEFYFDMAEDLHLPPRYMSNARYSKAVDKLDLNYRAFALKPLVIKGQMTPAQPKKHYKTAFYLKNAWWKDENKRFIYLKPLIL